jgi:hypothetical protein
MTVVPQPHRARHLWLGSIGVLAIFFFLASSLQIDRVVSGACQVDPCMRWSLTELRAGSFESRTLDLVSGDILDYRLYQFDRPAFLNLELPGGGKSAGAGQWIERGQAVAKIQSSGLDLELAERRTALEEARAELSQLQGGSKPEELDRARIAERRARAELDTFLPQYQRQRGLHDEGIVSEDIWEETAARKNLLELDLELAAAQVRVLASDAQPEEIAGAEATLRAIADELAAVESMHTATEICAPLTGQLRAGDGLSLAGDALPLMSIARLDTMVVQILIPQHLAYLVREGIPFKIYVPGVTTELTPGEVVRVDRRASSTMAGSFILVYGLVANEKGDLAEGMRGRVKLSCGKDTLLGRLWHDLSQSFKLEMWPL